MFWCLILFVVFSYGLHAQVFQGQQNLPIPPGAASGSSRGVTISEAVVTNIGTLGGCRQLDRVLMNISHTWVGDVAIFLVSPSGTVLELTSGNGGSANDWANTVFTDDAPLNIVDGTAPYTGTFRPEGRQQSLEDNPSNAGTVGTFTLANTFTGENADGIWQLYVNDYVGGDVGEIFNWELEFSADSELSATLTASALAVCLDEEVTLTVGGNLPPTSSYLWETGEITSSITDSPSASTLYSVTITDGDCSIELSVPVDVNLRPTITGPTSTCGDPITLTSPGNIGATWSNGASGQSITVNPTSTTTYTVSNGSPSCQSEPFTVEVVPLSLTASASADQICAGVSVLLTASGGSAAANYVWSTGATGNTTSVVPSATTTYEVTVTEGACSQTETVTVTVEESTVVASPDQQICAGETIELTASGSGPFSWSTGEVGDRIFVTPTTTSTYTVSVGSGDCTASDEVVVSVNPEVNVSASANQTSICAGEAVVLTATGDGPFVWSTGASGAQITVTPDFTTTYFVDVSNGPCTNFA